ncbi:MAG: hypothetical protein ABI647_22930 [Gemmatimonadota bacterium]
MAVDHAMLSAARDTGQGFIRCYHWAPHCLSFGRHEPALRRYDRTRIEALGISTVRRPTGGRAVWHARELTYAVAAPIAAFGTLKDAYHGLHQAIAAALAALGLPVELAGEGKAPGPDAGPCFAVAVGGEVTAGGRKMVGSAQYQDGGAFLQHGSLLLEDDQSLVHSVLRGAGPPSHDVTVSGLLGRPVSFAEVAALLLEPLAATLGLGSAADGPPDVVASLAPEYLPRYASSEWTWSR